MTSLLDHPHSVFVDTSGWVDLVDPDDSNHTTAGEWMKENRSSLATTDFILDET